jgi:acyl carrier protein
MSILDRFRPPHRPGLRYSDEARHWATTHFPESHSQIAAVAAGILCEQTGAPLSKLCASTRFIQDIGFYDYFDTVDYSKAVQQEFQLVIPDCDLAKIHCISDLVKYLHERIAERAT